MKKIIIAIFIVSIPVLSQFPYQDNAGNYSSWSDNDNQGTGFGAWDLWTENTSGSAFAGHFLGSSSSAGFGDINTSEKAFGMYGNPTGSFPQANAQRGFNYGSYTSLQDNITFKIELAVAYRNGYKGIDIYTEGFSQTINLLNVTDDKYYVNGVDQGWTYSQSSVFVIEVTQTSSTQIYYRVTRGTDVVGPTAVTTTGRIAYFKCYVGNTSGSDALNNLFFNNLEIRDTNPLPVELTSFTATAKSRGVELAWNTATEVNNYGFEVERKALKQSSDGSLNQWTKIGFVEGNGTTNVPKSYTFIDGTAQGTVAYRLKQIDRDGQFEYSHEVEATVGMPAEFALMQNHPNPFNPATSISYTLPAAGHVTLIVYDLIGKEVATLVNGMQDAGVKNVTLDASQLPSGMYFYTLRAIGFSATKKMLLVK